MSFNSKTIKLRNECLERKRNIGCALLERLLGEGEIEVLDVLVDRLVFGAIARVRLRQLGQMRQRFLGIVLQRGSSRVLAVLLKHSPDTKKTKMK